MTKKETEQIYLRDTVVSFGRIWIRTRNEKREIELPIHFLIQKTGIGFVSLCLDLSCEGYGSSLEDAISEMLQEIDFFAKYSQRESFENRYKENYLEEEWALYRALEASKR